MEHNLVGTRTWFGTEPELIELINSSSTTPPWFDLTSEKTSIVTFQREEELIGYAFAIPQPEVLQVVWLYWEPGYARKVIRDTMLAASDDGYQEVAVLIDTNVPCAQDRMEELLRGEFRVVRSDRNDHVWLVADCI